MTKPREQTREELTDAKAGARLPIVGTAPFSFLLFRGTLKKHFLRFEYKVSSMPFSHSGSHRSTGVFSP